MNDLIKKKKEKKFSLKFQLASEFSLTYNVINDYCSNKFFEFDILRIIYNQHFPVFNKLFLFSNQLNRIIQFIQIDQPIVKKSFNIIENKKIYKNPIIIFAYFLQDLLFSGFTRNHLLVNFFCELEFIFERKKDFYFFKNFFHLFFWIFFVNISLFVDQTIVEHILSFMKSFTDFRIDLNGINKIRSFYVQSDQYYLDIISQLYETNVLQIFRKNSNYLYSKNLKIFNFRVNFRNVYNYFIFKIKIRANENSIRESFESSKFIKLRYFNSDKTNNFCLLKINQSCFFYFLNFFIDCFKIDTGFVFYSLIELYWFHFSVKYTHIISHSIDKLFVNIQQLIRNKKKSKFFMFNQLWFTNPCNLSFCHKTWLINIIKNFLNLDIKDKDFFIEWVCLFESNQSLKIILKNTILYSFNQKDLDFYLELFQKILKLKNSGFFNILKIRKFLNFKKNKIKFCNQVFFMEKIFNKIFFTKKNLFNDLKFFLKKDIIIFTPEYYSMYIILSITLANLSIFKQLVTLENLKKIIYDNIITKASKFYCIKTFVLPISCNHEINNLILLEKIDFLNILDLNSFGRIVIVTKKVSLLKVLSLVENYKFFLDLFDKNKKIIKKDKKKISKLIKKYRLKTKIFIKPYIIVKQVETSLNYKSRENESSILEFFELLLNKLFEPSNNFLFLFSHNQKLYMEWKLFIFFSALFKKKTNKFKLKWFIKIITNKIIFMYKQI